MYQAIITKFLGPTNTKPARIKAKLEFGRLTKPIQVTLSFNHNTSIEANHRHAAYALAVHVLNWQAWKSDKPIQEAVFDKFVSGYVGNMGVHVLKDCHLIGSNCST